MPWTLSQLTTSGQTWLWTGLHSLAKVELIPSFRVPMGIAGNLGELLFPYKFFSWRPCRVQGGDQQRLKQLPDQIRGSNEGAAQCWAVGCAWMFPSNPCALQLGPRGSTAHRAVKTGECASPRGRI